MGENIFTDLKLRGWSMFLSVSHEEVNRLKLGVSRKVIHF